MKHTLKTRIWAILLAACLLVGLIPMGSPVEAEAVSGISNLTCASFISNEGHRVYIDTMMKHYLNNNSKLTTALDNGKNVIFMFEGGSDNYPSNTYEDTAYDTRTQAVVIVVQKDSSGNAKIVFYSENCSSIPDDPDNCTGAAYSGATTIADGIYGVQTTNHTGPYGALNTYASQGYYTPPGDQDGFFNGCSGINVHTRTSAGSGGGWSLGCQVIGYGNSSANEFNAFMKAVTGITYNVWVTYKSALYTLSGSNLYKDVGYYVLDRQLALENASGTHYGSGSLIEIYNSTALTNITEWSTAERAKASFGYTSKCTPYPASCEIEITGDTQINSQPRSVSTADDSVTLEIPNVGDRYTATKLYKNTFGNYWYEVISKSGEIGYAYGGTAKFIRQITDDISLSSGATSPNGHVAGSIFVVNGTISSKYNQLTKASVYIHSGFGTSGAKVTGDSATLSGTSYVLDNSTIDYNTAFDVLTAGKYTYAVSAEYINYYTTSATTVESNTGTVSLMEDYFMVINSSVSQSSCAHSYSTTNLKSATCTESGLAVQSCATCGKVVENAVSALGHAYPAWSVTNATCTADGSKTRTCGNCGNTETEVIKATGHNYSVTSHDATCKNYETFHYSCSGCGDSFDITAEELAKTWSESKPQGVDDSRIETKTQYRYADCTSASWVESGSNKVAYVDTWPSGFSTSNSLYSKYNKKADKVTESETDAARTVVNSDKIAGYLYYHWCDPSVTSCWAYQTDPYNTFHAYYDTTDPSNYDCDTFDYSYKTSHSSCSNSNWWLAVEVYEQSYTNYTKVPDGKTWGEWSAWSDTVYTAVENNRKVETRTMYRLKDAELGDHSWSNGICSVCGEVCAHPSYTNNICTVCGKTKLADVDFYLFGFINGADYGCEGDYENLGEYKFVDGKLTARFDQTSYVAVKTGDNQNWYMTNGYPGNYVDTAVLYNTSVTGDNSNKLYVPGGVAITFTLVDNGNDTFTLSYAPADIVSPTITLKYPTLSFEGEVFYNVYFTASDVGDVEEMGLLTWYEKPASLAAATYENAEAVIPDAVYNSANGTYMVRTQGIPAKQLGDNLFLRVYAKLTDGSYVYSGVTYYNAKYYANDILTNSTNEKMKSLVVAMLNYGAAAQVHFGHNADTLMNAGLTAEQKALVSAYSDDMISSLITPDSAKTTNFRYNKGYSGGYPSVSFEGAFSINCYLTPKYPMESKMTLYCWDLNTYNSVSQLTKENAVAAVEMGQAANAGQYVGAYSGIAAKQIDETVFVVAEYVSDGVTYYSPVITYSIGAYCKDQIESGSATMKAFAKETAVYGFYADAYFDQNS